MNSVQQRLKLQIDEAYILFYSTFYDHLQCRVVENDTNLVIVSKLINNCFETNFNINRDLEEFSINLYQGAILIGSFSFTEEDLHEAVFENDGMDNTSFKKNRRSKFIKFIKQNDCCTLYFKIKFDDVIFDGNQTQTDYCLYEQHLRSLANKVYAKLQNIAVNRIKKLEMQKLQPKRLSLIENVQNYAVSLNEGIQNEVKCPSNPISTHKFSNQNSEQKISKFTQSYGNFFNIKCKENQSKKLSKRKATNSKLIKLREDTKKIFWREIKQLEKKEQIIIPKAKANPNLEQLLSEGIVCPQKFKNNRVTQSGIKFSAFLEVPSQKNTFRQSSQIKTSQSFFYSNRFSSGIQTADPLKFVRFKGQKKNKTRQSSADDYNNSIALFSLDRERKQERKLGKMIEVQLDKGVKYKKKLSRCRQDNSTLRKYPSSIKFR